MSILNLQIELNLIQGSANYHYNNHLSRQPDRSHRPSRNRQPSHFTKIMNTEQQKVPSASNSGRYQSNIRSIESQNHSQNYQEQSIGQERQFEYQDNLKDQQQDVLSIEKIKAKEIEVFAQLKRMHRKQKIKQASLKEPQSHHNSKLIEKREISSKYEFLQPRKEIDPSIETENQGINSLIERHIAAIRITSIVWHKNSGGLFDYEEQRKIVKSSSFIDEASQVAKAFNIRSSSLERQSFQQSNSQGQKVSDLKLIMMFQDAEKRLKPIVRSLSEVEQTLFRIYESNEVNLRKQSEKEISLFVCALRLDFIVQTQKVKVTVFSLTQILEMSGVQHNKHLTMACLSKNTPLQSPYFIVRSLAARRDQAVNHGFRLFPGDLIRLGRVDFKIVSIDGVSCDQEETTEGGNCSLQGRYLEQHEIEQDLTLSHEPPAQILEEIECKYCLAGPYPDENPQDSKNFFVHLCDCKGHIGYVHYDCLTKWTMTKATVEQSNSVKMYFMDKMKCEVCTKVFPKCFKRKGKSRLYHLLPIELKQKHIMLVEQNSSQHKENLITAVISFMKGQSDNDGKVLIGRGRNSEMRINDISVSRQHALLQKVGDDYFIQDCKSKFGTTIRHSQSGVEAQLSSRRGFQVNNCIFTIQVDRKAQEEEECTQERNKQTKIRIEDQIEEESNSHFAKGRNPKEVSNSSQSLRGSSAGINYSSTQRNLSEAQDFDSSMEEKTKAVRQYCQSRQRPGGNQKAVLE